MSLNHAYVSDGEHDSDCRWQWERRLSSDPDRNTYDCPQCRRRTCFCSGGSDNSICDQCHRDLKSKGMSDDEIAKEWPP